MLSPHIHTFLLPVQSLPVNIPSSTTILPTDNPAVHAALTPRVLAIASPAQHPSKHTSAFSRLSASVTMPREGLDEESDTGWSS